MRSPARPSAARQALTTAIQALQSGNLAMAEMALAPLFVSGIPADPDLLNTAGSLRMNQGRLGEAAELFAQAMKIAPRDALYAFNQGLALTRLGRLNEAETALRAAVKNKQDFTEALFELGALLHRSGKLEEAEKHFRHILRVMPAHVHAKLALGAVLVDAKRPAEAEAPLRRALNEAAEPRLKEPL